MRFKNLFVRSRFNFSKYRCFILKSYPKLYFCVDNSRFAAEFQEKTEVINQIFVSLEQDYEGGDFDSLMAIKSMILMHDSFEFKIMPGQEGKIDFIVSDEIICSLEDKATIKKIVENINYLLNIAI